MNFKIIDGGVTAPKGFKAAGIAAGIKKSGKDMALIVSQQSSAVAGVFTTNKVQAAPVLLCKAVTAAGKASAIIINSGNANACTGAKGSEAAALMAEFTAAGLGVEPSQVLVCSTGAIGVSLPMDIVEEGVLSITGAASVEGGQAAAEAIMTTDTVSKTAAVQLEIDGKTVTIGGMAKGAGMIEPNMATMLAFLTTDADVNQSDLQECLTAASNVSFNRISVDGDQSTNDTVLFLANGMAGNSSLNKGHADWASFVAAVETVAMDLAVKIVKDGEGATKFVTVNVRGAQDNIDALKVCRAIANSLLVKTSWFGEDPNWGRVIDAVGYSGAELDPQKIDIYYDDFCAVKDGCSAGPDVIEGIAKVIAGEEFSLSVDLNLGDGADTVYACDCSYEYVKINSEYTT
ncbi:bifunctional ornithine acetyltransferase/N-acetylglutamate synthase [bacterium E08(2017)]|nr:bifunctional ornithine acetyltransferase/N-acetylglutamate synthase [bacterium E08(2017)]